MVPTNPNPEFDRLVAMQERPTSDPVMRQHWRNLLFAHARCDASGIAEFLPPGLELQTFDGSAWVGFVPFAMRSLRSFRLTYPDFLETNLRTYVSHPIHGPGVWFFSLDANSYPPCLGARSRFKLPYCYAGMDMVLADDAVNYYGTRVDRQRLPRVFETACRDFRYTAEISILGTIEMAEPESFDFWLLERYRLYAADRQGRLLTGRVWHEPYQVIEPEVRKLELVSNDPRLAGLEFEHFRYCPGVQVDCFRPEWI